ncbi:ABC transporter ATP-binding protein [Streptomyces sp. NBC_01643]|uniref:ABC transporter ATP-binding protein n=1 Tax=Streptomyces sp. NBC_01643 TaxID=2975906 RepID=UPI002F91BA41|nr:ABC transporter ATP-binding protein [Streptomyces sp. NBC_01643]
MPSKPADARLVTPSASESRDRTLFVKGLSKVFLSADGPIAALDHINLTIPAGEFIAILGPSGCGKSTLMAIMAGLEPASAGQVQLGGVAVTSPVLEAGFMFQRDLLLDWRTCEDNILLQFQMRGQSGAPHRERARELLSLVGVSQFAQRHPRELSGGMRQRVALCRALVHDPPLLFMDEPFGALDALTRENLNLELSRIAHHSGTTVVLVTHSIDEAVFLADRVVVMSSRPGHIVGEVRINLPRPRENVFRELPEFVEGAARLRGLLTHDARERDDG